MIITVIRAPVATSGSTRWRVLIPYCAGRESHVRRDPARGARGWPRLSVSPRQTNEPPLAPVMSASKRSGRSPLSSWSWRRPPTIWSRRFRRRSRSWSSELGSGNARAYWSAPGSAWGVFIFAARAGRGGVGIDDRAGRRPPLLRRPPSDLAANRHRPIAFVTRPWSTRTSWTAARRRSAAPPIGCFGLERGAEDLGATLRALAR